MLSLKSAFSRPTRPAGRDCRPADWRPRARIRYSHEMLSLKSAFSRPTRPAGRDCRPAGCRPRACPRDSREMLSLKSAFSRPPRPAGREAPRAGTRGVPSDGEEVGWPSDLGVPRTIGTLGERCDGGRQAGRLRLARSSLHGTLDERRDEARLARRSRKACSSVEWNGERAGSRRSSPPRATLDASFVAPLSRRSKIARAGQPLHGPGSRSRGRATAAECGCRVANVAVGARPRPSRIARRSTR
jgi:hypothetical protein